MLYGKPDPASITALGIDVQPGSSINEFADLNKVNLNGIPKEEGTLTFTFTKAVTDPILDLSGLGGFTQAVEKYMYDNDGPFYVARASFNSTDLELLDKGIIPQLVAKNLNLTIEGKTVKVINRNTHTRASVDLPDGYAIHMYGLRSPKLEPAGCGSVMLKGTFKQVSFKLYHVATPYSAFPENEYGTSDLYFWNSGAMSSTSRKTEKYWKPRA